MIVSRSYELGATYSDIITGMSGIATGYVQYLTGCNQVLLQPKSKNGGNVESFWVDEQRLTKLDKKVIELLVLKKVSGFDKPAPRM
jgi:hypothetical protein